MKALIIIGSFLLLVTIMISCQSEQEIEFNRYYSAGATVYQSHCQNCHGDKGQGLAALIPPLNDSVYLKANKNLLACYLQNGLKDKITINGKEFEGQLPAAGLSPPMVDRLIEVIQRMRADYGVTVLLVEHVMRVVQAVCDRVVVLDYGEKIADAAPSVAINDPRVIEAYLGTGRANHA